MTTLTIQNIRASGRDNAFDTLAKAFEADPVARWLFPHHESYRDDFRSFAEAFAGLSIEAGAATEAGGFAGVSLWIPPGLEADEENLLAVLEAAVPAGRQAALWAVLEQMDRFHPHESHWYLPLLGVSPGNQGQGLGSALLESALERCDLEGLPAYLESSNAANLSLYLRHGFETVGQIRVPSAPPLYPMIRRPR